MWYTVLNRFYVWFLTKSACNLSQAACSICFFTQILKCSQKFLRLTGEHPIRYEAVDRSNRAAEPVIEWPDDRAVWQVFPDEFTRNRKDQIGLEKWAARRLVEIGKG